MIKYNDFVIDYETLSSLPNATLVDMSIVLFDPDPNVVQTFEELVASGRRWKFNIKAQAGRHIMPETVDWWKGQNADAKAALKPDPTLDVDIKTATLESIQWLKENNVDQWKSQGWSRGNSFDFAIYVQAIREALGKDYTQKDEPVFFWNQRETRTAIEALSLTRGLTMTPLHKDKLKGFIHHNSIHDCAKDAIMLKTAMRYALSLEKMPKAVDIHPDTMKPKQLAALIESEKEQS